MRASLAWAAMPARRSSFLASKCSPWSRASAREAGPASRVIGSDRVALGDRTAERGPEPFEIRVLLDHERLGVALERSESRRRQAVAGARVVGVVVLGPVADALEPLAVGKRQPERRAPHFEDACRTLRDAHGDAVDLRAGRELARQLEQRLGALRLPALGLVELGVDERDRRVPGQHLEEAEVVRVELVEAELREHQDPDDVGAVSQRHGEQGLLDLRRPFDVVPDAAVRRVAGQERGAGRGHVARHADADLDRQHVEHRARRLGQRAAEGDGPQVVTVAQEDAAVVVIDQQPQLVCDRERRSPRSRAVG